MRKKLLLLSTYLLLLFTVQLYGQSSMLVIRNVQIVDVASGQLLPGAKDIIIEEGRITQIANYGTVRLIGGFTSFDGKGKYVIPGLWDMHTHPDDPELWRMEVDASDRDWLMPQFVVYGVTGIRDMAGSLAVVKEWKRKGASGDLLVPEIFAAGPLLDGPNPMWDGSVGISGPADVKTIVDSLRKAGVDFLKVYSLLPREIYFALSKYAREINFPICGHVPLKVSSSEAAKSGLNSQEHLLEILLECSDRESDLRNNTIDFGSAKGLDRYVLKQQLMMDTYNPEKAEKLFQTFKQHATWHTPTLNLWYKNAWFEREYEKDKALYKYLPAYIRKYWTIGVNDHLNYRDHQGFIDIKQKLYQKYLELVKAMHGAGVKLLAGTDMGANPLCFPGISIHDELEQFVRAGLSPAEALKTATINPAQYLTIAKDFGSVETGKIADLVILERNPLEDIQAVREIKAVVKDGKLYEQAKREAILTKTVKQLE